MSELTTSRDYSQRVELGFHRHGRPLRRRSWQAALVLSVLTVGWLVRASNQGAHHIYEAGHVADVHRMFENDCRKCHADREWTPLLRLMGLAETTSAVDDAKCVACHAGMPHFQLPSAQLANGSNPTAHATPHPSLTGAHASLRCADCHREHQGGRDLARVTNQLCVNCHRDLQHAVAGLDATNIPFAETVTDFDRIAGKTAGHPEFTLHKLRRGDEQTIQRLLRANAAGREHGAQSVVAPATPDTAWVDRAKIRFSHKDHFKTSVRWPGQDESESARLGDNCNACHQPDGERGLMLPIRYEQHCKTCHPLVFDAQRVRNQETGDVFFVDLDNRTLRNESGGQDASLTELNAFSEQSTTPKFRPVSAPHADPAAVRGYLTDFYALQSERRLTNSSSETKSSPNVLRPARPTDPEQLSRILELRREAEALLQRPAHNPQSGPQLPPELLKRFRYLQHSGGCGYCHHVTPGKTTADLWKIEPPRIPSRWLRHARFRHDAHRMVACTECHKNFRVDPSTGELTADDIATSHQTADVLIPPIGVCLQCHVKHPTLAGDSHPHPHSSGARNDCVDCHDYHKRGHEEFLPDGLGVSHPVHHPRIDAVRQAPPRTIQELLLGSPRDSHSSTTSPQNEAAQ